MSPIEQVRAAIHAAVSAEAESLRPDRIDAITNAVHGAVMPFIQAFVREISPGFLQRTTGKKDDATPSEARL